MYIFKQENCNYDKISKLRKALQFNKCVEMECSAPYDQEVNFKCVKGHLTPCSFCTSIICTHEIYIQMSVFFLSTYCMLCANTLDFFDSEKVLHCVPNALNRIFTATMPCWMPYLLDEVEHKDWNSLYTKVRAINFTGWCPEHLRNSASQQIQHTAAESNQHYNKLSGRNEWAQRVQISSLCTECHLNNTVRKPAVSKVSHIKSYAMTFNHDLIVA